MITITWDYETNIATRWLRMNTCNHCGECCERIIEITIAGDYIEDIRNGGDGVDEKNMWHEYIDCNNIRRFWKIMTISDDKNNDSCFENNCKKHKPLLCEAWPLHPDHVYEFNNCSYQFIKLDAWNFKED